LPRILASGRPYRIVVGGDFELQRQFATKWKSPKGEQVLSCTIITCDPNHLMSELHNRMPVILDETEWPQWLGEEPATENELLAMLKPCPDEALKIWAVDKMVGNVKNNGAQLLMPV
jgi:putative SOS response-associated peptidase YedK